MKYIAIGLVSVAASLSLACSGADQVPEPHSPSASRQTLSAIGDCEFAACGVLPSNLSSTPSVECAATPDAPSDCAWSASDASGSVSYRPCSASECPPAPTLDCPANTVRSSEQCGSENDGACAWTTVCAPPRDTTPCPDANGCGPEQDIGVICSDGSTGGLACVTDGHTCSWQRTCD